MEKIALAYFWTTFDWPLGYSCCIDLATLVQKKRADRLNETAISLSGSRWHLLIFLCLSQYFICYLQLSISDTHLSQRRNKSNSSNMFSNSHSDFFFNSL